MTKAARWDYAKTCIVSVVVGLLIWMWAEGESLKTAVATPTVQFVPADEGRLIAKVADPEFPGQLRVRLEGSTRAIDAVQRALARPIRLTPGRENVPSEPGEHRLAMRDVLRQIEALRETGVTVAATEPATVNIRVLRLVTREMPVQVTIEGIEIEGEPAVSPATVKVTLPEAVATNLPESATATARVDAEMMRAAGGGVASPDQRRRTIRRVPVRLPPGVAEAENVTLSPDVVDVTLNVLKATAQTVKPSVPVWIATPPREQEQGRWRVTLEDKFIRDVRVTGPSQIIQRIENDELKLIAYLELSSDELESGITSKAVTFERMPAAVQIEAENPVVRFTIEDTAAPEDGGTGGAVTPEG